MRQFELDIDQRLEIGLALCERIVKLELLADEYAGKESMKCFVANNLEQIEVGKASLKALDLAHMLPIYKRNNEDKQS